MANVLAYDIGMVAYFGELISIKSILFDMFRYFDIKNDIDDKTLFTIGEYGFRQDYLEIMDMVSSGVVSKKKINFSKQNNFCIPKFSVILNAYSICKGLFNHLDGIKHKVFIFNRTVFYLNSLNKIKKRKINIENYVAFSSVHTFEALLTNYFKSIGIKTYTLQHGVAHIHTGELPLDMLSYENFNADYQLCWGEYSKDQYFSYGINESALLVAGYPKKFNKSRVENVVTDKMKIIIFLSRYKYQKSNFDILDGLMKCNEFDVYLKPHPSLNKEHYRSYIEQDKSYWIDDLSVSESLSKKDWGFSVSINTSAYYESFLNGVVSFMYIDDDYEGHKVISGTDFCFIQQLLEKSKSVDEKRDIYNEELNYILGFNINKYKSILN
ncbi:MAG: hypothetical protein HRU38_20305 [Saccharospirillaceae bacterium]|nr:hypothetical protein [Saccharospirillaceae bacterium]